MKIFFIEESHGGNDAKAPHYRFESRSRLTYVQTINPVYFEPLGR